MNPKLVEEALIERMIDAYERAPGVMQGAAMKAALRVAFPAIRDACAEVAKRKRALWRNANGFEGHTAAAHVIEDETRALTLDALPAAPASEDAAEGGRKPDFVYDPDDWESTNTWEDRYLLVDGAPRNGDVFRYQTLLYGPEVFAAYVITSDDEDGEWQWFSSREKAEAAVAHGRTLIVDDEPALPQQQEQGGE